LRSIYIVDEQARFGAAISNAGNLPTVTLKEVSSHNT